jgi:hypothetical protein
LFAALRRRIAAAFLEIICRWEEDVDVPDVDVNVSADEVVVPVVLLPDFNPIIIRHAFGLGPPL